MKILASKTDLDPVTFCRGTEVVFKMDDVTIELLQDLQGVMGDEIKRHLGEELAKALLTHMAGRYV